MRFKVGKPHSRKSTWCGRIAAGCDVVTVTRSRASGLRPDIDLSRCVIGRPSGVPPAPRSRDAQPRLSQGLAAGGDRPMRGRTPRGMIVRFDRTRKTTT